MLVLASSSNVKFLVSLAEKKKNKFGVITRVVFEPRLKRDKIDIWLGEFDHIDEAKLVRDIAIFFYENDDYGWLDLENGCYSAVQPDPDQEGGRYFRISKLPEEEEGEQKAEGKQKAELVQRKVKEVHEQFKEKQGQFIINLYLVTSPDMRDGEQHANGRSDDMRPALMNTQLQQPPRSDRIDNPALNLSMPDYRGTTSNISSGDGPIPEPTSFQTANSLPFSDHRGLLGNVHGLPREEALRAELPGLHAITYEAGQTIAHVPFPNGTLASGFDFNTDNQVQSLLQALNTSQQEKQELKRKFGELKAQLSELQHVKDRMSSCPEASQPSKRR